MSLRLSAPLSPDALHPSFKLSETSIEDPFQLDHNISHCPRSILVSSAQRALGTLECTGAEPLAANPPKTQHPTKASLQNGVTLPVDMTKARAVLLESLVALEFTAAGGSNMYTIADEATVNVAAHCVSWTGARKKLKGLAEESPGRALFGASIKLAMKEGELTDITFAMEPGSEREHYQLFYAVIKRMLLAHTNK